MRKLRCDRCGLELTEKEDLDAAYEGQEAWYMAQRSRGLKARGVLPCKNYIRCHGEVVEVTRWSQWRERLFGGR